MHYKEKKKLGSVIYRGYINGLSGFDSCRQCRYSSSLQFSPFPSSVY
jgi:hypothetical protein